MEGDDYMKLTGLMPLGISIHTLRMEGDAQGRIPGGAGQISIHTLRMEGDSSP